MQALEGRCEEGEGKDEEGSKEKDEMMRREGVDEEREKRGEENSNWQHNTKITNYIFQSRTCGSPSQR